MQIDTNIFYIVITGESIDEVVKTDLKEEYDHGGKAINELQWMQSDKRTPWLFKDEFQVKRIISWWIKAFMQKKLMKIKNLKISCKRVLRRNNVMALKG